jgi:anti-sigma-K factor RskA
MTPREPTGRRSSPEAGDHEVFDELAVGYALHALEPEDELRFTAHLASCATCERSLAEHVDTLGQLAYDVPPAAPPPAVLDGIRAAVAAEGGRATTGSGPVPDLPSRGPADPDDELARARRRREPVPVQRSWLLAGAAAVVSLVLGLGAWNAVLQTDRAEQIARGDRLEQAVEALEQPGARTVQLADFDGNIMAVVIAHGQQMSLVVDGLAPNPDDTVYVLWGQNVSGEVRALSTFDVPAEGLDVLAGMPLQLSIDELDTLMVTHEHGRTPPAQTQEPVLVAGSV